MKETKGNAFPEITEKAYRRDSENRIIVNMNVKDDSDFLSVFSVNETPVISNEVAEFLENSTQIIRADEHLTLCIKSDCIDETEQKLYTAAIKEYYSEKYCSNDREWKVLNRIALILAMVGILILSFAVFLEYQKNSVIWAEVIDIAAWVFLWEAVDIKFFKTRELKQKRKRYAAFISMNIQYKNQE